jgi:opacity protein-like surface antigen
MRRFVSSLVLALSATTGAAQAADMFNSPQAVNYGPFYGSATLGYAVLNDVGWSVGATGFGLTITGAGDFEFDGGPTGSAIVGYDVTDWLSVEVEASLSSFAYDSVSGAGTITDGVNIATIAGSATIDGEITLFTGTANVIVSPFSFDAFRPYVGAGVGFAHINDDVNSVAGLTALAYSDSYTDIAATAIAGFDMSISDQLSAGARYQFVWADTGTSVTDDATGHAFMLTGTYRF